MFRHSHLIYLHTEPLVLNLNLGKHYSICPRCTWFSVCEIVFAEIIDHWSRVKMIHHRPTVYTCRPVMLSSSKTHEYTIDHRATRLDSLPSPTQFLPRSGPRSMGKVTHWVLSCCDLFWYIITCGRFTWIIYPYSLGMLHWHWVNLKDCLRVNEVFLKDMTDCNKYNRALYASASFSRCTLCWYIDNNIWLGTSNKFFLLLLWRFTDDFHKWKS